MSVSRIAAFAVACLSSVGAHANLIRHYTFDVPGQVTDHASNTSATPVNLEMDDWTTDVPGPGFGRSLRFDGIEERVDLASITFPSNTNFSVAFWYKGTETRGNLGVDQNRGLVGWNGDLYANLGINAGRVQYMNYDGAWRNHLTSTTVIADNTWHHVALVNYSNQTAAVFVDGVQEASGSSVTTGYRYIISQLMQGYSLYGNNRYAQGMLDDVRIYSSALTAGQVLELATIPEPASLGVAALGATALLRRRRVG